MTSRRRLLRIGLGIYLALLVASYAWRALPRGGPDEAEGANATVAVRAVNEGRRLDSSVEIAFIERGSGAPAVLLLHGSPGSNSDVRRLALLLGNDYRTIAPDLPGFGRSQRDVPDYSIAAHADYAAQLLDHLEIRQVHLVGFSMGGGVALELARQGDERIRSLTLLASIGAQEFELFGDYHLNHAVHGAQLAALWAVHRLTPHFGLLDGVMLSIPYGRNFFDSDQRPLREALGALEVPTLILHGRETSWFLWRLLASTSDSFRRARSSSTPPAGT